MRQHVQSTKTIGAHVSLVLVKGKQRRDTVQHLWDGDVETEPRRMRPLRNVLGKALQVLLESQVLQVRRQRNTGSRSHLGLRCRADGALPGSRSVQCSHGEALLRTGLGLHGQRIRGVLPSKLLT